MAAKASVWLFCIFFLCCASLPDGRHLQIVIRTTRESAFGGAETSVRIERKNGKYAAGNMEIPDEQVTAFLVAVDTRSEGPVSFSDLGITQNWLDQNAEPAFDEYFQGRSGSILPSQKDLFVSRFRSASAIGQAVDEYFQSYWTDDFPTAHVEVYDHTSGRAIVLESSAQHAFMIPWIITEIGRNRLSFNANIGRTLGALLPEKAALKERISGAYFRCALSQSVYQQIWPEWRKLDRNPHSKIPIPCAWLSAHLEADLDPCCLPDGD